MRPSCADCVARKSSDLLPLRAGSASDGLASTGCSAMQAHPAALGLQLHNLLAKPSPMARAFYKGLSHPARPADASSSRLLANLVSQAEQGSVQPQTVFLVQFHHLSQQSSW